MQLNRYLDWTIKISLWLILFTPLFVSDSMFFPFITGKNFLFRILVEIIFTLWIILSLRDRSYLPKKSWLFIFVFSLLGSLTLGTLFGVDVSRSFWSNFERMEGLLGHLHLFAYFLVLISVLRSEKDWWKFFHVSLIASILVGGYAILQLAGYKEIHQGGVRVDSTLGNATYLAVYMLFHLFLLLYYFLKKSSVAWRIGYAAAFLFEAFILYETATRGAILGFIGGLFLFAILFAFLSKERRWRFFAFGVVGLIFLALFGFYLIWDSEFVKESPTLARLRNISLEDDTTKARFYIWQMSFEGFKARPVFGWGPENFTVVFSNYFDPRLWKQEPWFDRSHNAIFDWLTAGGIFSLAAYLGIFLSALWLLFKIFRENKISNLEFSVFVGLLGAYFFQNLFVFDQLTSYLMLFAVLGYIHFLFSSAGDQIPAKSTLLVPRGAQQVWSSVAIVGLAASLYFLNAKPVIANFSLLSALQKASEGKYQETQDAFRRAISLSPLGRREAREQYEYFASLLAQKQEIPESFRVSILNEAIFEAKLQVQDSPRDARNYLFLGSVYNSAGRRTEAIKAFEKALELSPSKQQIIFLLAHTYFNNGNVEKAVELAERGAKLDLAYSDAQHDFITLAIRAGRDELALQSIKELSASGLADHKNLKSWASIYAGEKKYDIAVQIYLEVLKLVPVDTQARISLAASYYELGRIDLAIEEIRKAVELDPSFKEQGEFFIKELEAGRKPS